MLNNLHTLPPIRVVPFSHSECPRAPTSGPPLFTWREFYSFRNTLLRILSRYGTTGPSGELPILETWELSEDAWKSGTSNPDFFVVSDMWNQWSRWNRVESSPQYINTDVLTELVTMLLDWTDWCVYLALREGGLTVFSNRILYEGNLFQGAESIEVLAERCAMKEPDPSNPV